jgi:hypothetical protein
MSLNEHPYYPYPRDTVTRFGFIIGDIIAWSIMALILYITLKATLRL